MKKSPATATPPSTGGGEGKRRDLRADKKRAEGRGMRAEFVESGGLRVMRHVLSAVRFSLGTWHATLGPRPSALGPCFSALGTQSETGEYEWTRARWLPSPSASAIHLERR